MNWDLRKLRIFVVYAVLFSFIIVLYQLSFVTLKPVSKLFSVL